MNINVEPFKDFMKKATLNYLLDDVQLVISPDRAKSKMTTETEDVVVFIDKENDVIEGLPDELSLNFNEPKNVTKQLNFIDGGQGNFRPSADKVVVKAGKQKSTFYLCSPVVVHIFERTFREDEIDFFLEVSVDEEFIDMATKIKRFGSAFKEVYFSVENGKMYIESVDKTNDFCDSLKFQICDVDSDDCFLGFTMKNFDRLIDLIKADCEDYTIKFHKSDKNEGILFTSRNDGSEIYVLMSIVE